MNSLLIGLVLLWQNQTGPATLAGELACLTDNIYYEARGEPIPGQLAVALVTLHRKDSPRFPDTICDVVHQPYAFSWTRQKIGPRKRQWYRLRELGVLAMMTYPLWNWEADFFHNDRVHPYWANKLTPVGKIGKHNFYKRVKQ